MRPGFPDRLKVELLPNGKTWVLLAPLRYDSAILGARLTVPLGFRTDFASVPRLPFAFWLTGDTAHAPAVVHDYLYRRHLFSRRISDTVFLEAMKAEGDPWWRRCLMYQAVRWFGGKAWDAVNAPTRYEGP